MIEEENKVQNYKSRVKRVTSLSFTPSFIDDYVESIRYAALEYHKPGNQL
jgi:hypothetical protein